MAKQGIRVYALARELDVTGPTVLDAALRLGYKVPNQLSSLPPLQRAAIEAALRWRPPEQPTGVTSRLRPRDPPRSSPPDLASSQETTDE